MRLRLFNLAAAMSAALCLAVAALWVLSYRASDILVYSSGGGREIRSLRNFPGTLQYNHSWLLVAGSKWETPEGLSYRRNKFGGVFPQLPGWGGFAVSDGEIAAGAYTQHHTSLRVPHWAIVLLLAVAPLRWVVIRVRHSRRERAGLCQACGYDLRATPDRCPECGTRVPAGKPANMVTP